jgi:hypothetical protein
VSIDYYAIVPADRWPSFGSMQATLDENTAGVRLRIPEGLTAEDAFATARSGNGVDVVCAGLSVSITMTFRPLTVDDVDADNDHDDAHEAIVVLVEQGIPVQAGDVLIWMGGGTSAFDWHPGFLIFAALAESFGATVVDPQTGQAYRKQDVADLVDIAADMRTELDANRHLYRVAGPWG